MHQDRCAHAPGRAYVYLFAKILNECCVSSLDVYVKDLRNHPELSSLTAICLSNGHVLMIDLSAENKFGVVSSLTQGSPVCSRKTFYFQRTNIFNLKPIINFL